MLVLYLSNRYVRVLDGSVKGKRISLKRVAQTFMPEGSIINGVITDEEAFFGHLSEFWTKNNLPAEEVFLVVNTNKITTRLLNIPTLSMKQSLQYLPREFIDLEYAQGSIYSYWELKKDKASKKTQVLASVAEYELIDNYLQSFANIGIKISGVCSTLTSVLKILMQLSQLAGKTCLVQLVDDNILGNFLFVKGEYFYSEWLRLLNEPDTPEFSDEIGRSVEKIIQFARARQIETPIRQVYITQIDSENLNSCRGVIHMIDPALEVDNLSEGNLLQNQLPGTGFGDLLPLLGALAPFSGNDDLFAQYKLAKKSQAKQNEWLKLAFPALVLAGVLAVVALVFAAVHLVEFLTLRNLDNFNQRDDVMEARMEYDRLETELTQLEQEYLSSTVALDNIYSYPTINSDLEKILLNSASGLAEIEVVSFNADTGIISFNAYAREVDLVNKYIWGLEQKDIFCNVHYTGYTWQEKTGRWKINVVCPLTASAGRELEEAEEVD